MDSTNFDTVQNHTSINQHHANPVLWLMEVSQIMIVQEGGNILRDRAYTSQQHY